MLNFIQQNGFLLCCSFLREGKSSIYEITSIKVKAQVKLSLCLTKYQAMKMYPLLN